MISGSFEARVEKHAITVPQWVALRTLYDVEKITPLEAAERIGVDKSTFSRMLDRLEAKSLVTRLTHNADGRSFFVALTDSARALVVAIAKEADTNDALFFGHITPKEQETLRNLILQLLKATGGHSKIALKALTTRKEKMMNIQEIKDAIALSLSKEISFPELIERLTKAGAERYTVDFVAKLIHYYGKENEYFSYCIESENFGLPASTFCEESIRNAIEAAQALLIDYETFAQRVIDGGAAQYQIFFKERKQLYLGREGSVYAYPFPQF